MQQLNFAVETEIQLLLFINSITATQIQQQNYIIYTCRSKQTQFVGNVENIGRFPYNKNENFESRGRRV